MKKRMVSLLLILGTSYILALVVLFFFQRSFLYFPTRDLGLPEQYGAIGFRVVTLQAEDGVSLITWHHLAAPGFSTIIYCHGNAGHLGFRVAKYQALADAGFGVLALEYRGFGTSGGSPTEQGLYADARAAVRYATDSLAIPLHNILMYGESLGSGVAVQMATEFRMGGLILEAPYTSVLRRAQERFFHLVPVRLMLHDQYNSISKIKHVHTPLLLFHGARDAIIPLSDGRELLAAAHSPKEGVFYEDVDHTQFPLGDLTQNILRFGRTHGWIPAEEP